jgi:hypothetical protein
MNITTSKRVRTEGGEKPTTLFDFHRKNGSWSINFDPIQETRTEHNMSTDDSSTKTRQVWTWYIIDIGGIRNEDNAMRKVLDYFWGVDYENKLINDIYSVERGIIIDPDEAQEIQDRYTTFLQERALVKQSVKNLFL